MALLWRWHKYRRQLGVSPIELITLLLLTERQKYGYEITQELRKWFGGFWKPNTGTIYHALQRLEKKGYATSSVQHREKGLDRKMYAVTTRGTRAIEKGVQYFRRQIEFLQRLTSLVEKHLGSNSDIE